MEFNYIVNPETGRKVSIYGKTGRRVLKKYAQSGGASSCTQFHGYPLKCNAHTEDDVNCVYTAGKFTNDKKERSVGQCRKSTASDIDKARASARNRDSLEGQFNKAAGKMFLSKFNKRKLMKTVKDAVSQEEQRAMEREAEEEKQRVMALINRCGKCGFEVASYDDWNTNNCDECENQTEIFGDDAKYFRLRQAELKNFTNTVYPMLTEMAGNDSDMLGRFIGEFYSNHLYNTDTYEEFKAGFIKNQMKHYLKFVKKVKDLHKEYTKLVNDIQDINDTLEDEEVLSVWLNLDDESFYYYDPVTNESFYDMSEYISEYCSKADSANKCCKSSRCRWTGETVTCNNKKGCKNVYVDSWENNGCGKSEKVKRNKSYRSGKKGKCSDAQSWA